MKSLYLFLFLTAFQTITTATILLQQPNTNNTLALQIVTLTLNTNKTAFLEPLFNATRISAIKSLVNAINTSISSDQNYSELVQFCSSLTSETLVGKDDFKDEIRAIAKLANITIGNAFLMSHLTSLEVFNQGAQVLLQNSEPDQSYYGINFDSKYLFYIKTILVKVSVQDTNHNELYSGIMVAGCTGFLTAYNTKHAIGFSDFLDSGITIASKIENIKNPGKIDPMYAIRLIIENETIIDFATLESKIKELSNLTTGVIFGLKGKDQYEGMLIYHKGEAIMDTTQEVVLAAEKKNLTVTNYETNTKIPSEDTRQTEFENQMKNYTIWNQSLIETILKSYPLRNYYTSFTIVYYIDNKVLKNMITQYDYETAIIINDDNANVVTNSDSSTVIIIIIIAICLAALFVVFGGYIYHFKKKRKEQQYKDNKLVEKVSKDPQLEQFQEEQ